MNFLYTEQGFRNAIFLCHEFHELTRKAVNLVSGAAILAVLVAKMSI